MPYEQWVCRCGYTCSLTFETCGQCGSKRSDSDGRIVVVK